MTRLHAYAQLVRLPNLPSALADICLGALATGALFKVEGWLPFVLLLLASGCLYCAGMVWNDYFDVEQDKRERPFRPLPSGRITTRQAAKCGVGLVACGLLCAAAAGCWMAWRGGGSFSTTTGLAVGLTAAIFLYDGFLKRTPVGPLGMGACRFLNILLGFSLADAIGSQGWYVACVVGLYIIGVTWLARTEAHVSSRPALVGAAGLMFLSLALVLPLPTLSPGNSSVVFVPLLVALGVLVGVPVGAAVRTPSPERVQTAVKWSLMGLIVLDAVLASALAGSLGLVILLLLVPSLYLNYRRRLYAT
jgi:4-hydroxybenzoate polyprenyltransferase